MTYQRLTPAQFEALFGGTSDLARRLSSVTGRKVSEGTVGAWKSRGRIPALQVINVEKATGIARHRIRPDLYPAPDLLGAA